MSDITMEQKLQLIRQVRSRYHEDQYDLSNRERLLYGKAHMPERAGRSASYLNSGQDPYEDNYEDTCGVPSGSAGPVSFFRLRLLAALLLLATVILMDQNEIKVAGITTETIFRMISADYEDKITEWMETLSDK